MVLTVTWYWLSRTFKRQVKQLTKIAFHGFVPQRVDFKQSLYLLLVAQGSEQRTIWLWGSPFLGYFWGYFLEMGKVTSERCRPRMLNHVLYYYTHMPSLCCRSDVEILIYFLFVVDSTARNDIFRTHTTALWPVEHSVCQVWLSRIFHL